MAKFLFVLTRGPEDPTRAVRCFQFAKIAADKGHEVTVFLVDKGAGILVCKPCAETRMIGEEDLPPGTKIGTGMTLIDLAAESQVFTF